MTKSTILEEYWLEFLKHIRESQDTLQEYDPVEQDFWEWYLQHKLV